jgi:hypothetical protein
VRRFRFWAGVDGGEVRRPGTGFDDDINCERSNDFVLGFDWSGQIRGRRYSMVGSLIMYADVSPQPSIFH